MLRRTIILLILLFISAGIFFYFYYSRRYTYIVLPPPEERAGVELPAELYPGEAFDEEELTALLEREIIIKNERFEPMVATILPGGKIIWENRDPFKCKLIGEGWQSPPMRRGDSFSRKFFEVGNFEYYCEFNPKLKGRVVVMSSQM